MQTNSTFGSSKIVATQASPFRTLRDKYYDSDIPRINPDKKAFWVEALLSGKYTQGKNLLKTPRGNFCCLGVYCDAAGVPEHKEVGSWRDEITGAMMSGTMPTFGDILRDGVTQEKNTSSVVIPHDYAIDYIDVNPEDCRTWHAFTGDEDLFVCMEQGLRNDATGEPTLPEHHRLVHAYSLPNLNDSGEFNFVQITDIINYFL